MYHFFARFISVKLHEAGKLDSQAAAPLRVLAPLLKENNFLYRKMLNVSIYFTI